MPPTSFAASGTRRRNAPKAAPPTDRQPLSVAAFLELAAASPMQPPPKVRKVRGPNRKAGVWDKMTPEQRSEWGKYLASLRQPKNMARTKRRTAPTGWDHVSLAAANLKARQEAEALVAKLIASGAIAADDTEGAKATTEALTIVRSPAGRTDERKRWARRLLDHFHPDLAKSGLL